MRNAAGGDPVLVSVADGVGQIVLNRPDRRNALSRQMLVDLSAAVEELNTRDDVAAILLTGAGGSFCSGGDVQDFDEQGGEGGGATHLDEKSVDEQRRAQRMTVGAIHRAVKPVVAALPGPAAGAGMGLALAADIRLGTPRTVMVTAFAGVGLSGDFGVAWLLDRVVGPAKARELLFFSPRLVADECLALGLLNRVVPEDAFDDVALGMAKQLAHGPSQAFAGMKANLLRAPTETLEQSMDAEVELHKRTGLTDEHINAVRAFMSKRTPEFSNRWLSDSPSAGEAIQ